MVSERTACDRLVGRLVSYGEPEGVRSRLGMGMFLLRRVYEGYLSGEATRELPVDGIKEGLVAHGQAGQFYRHLYFHIGCRFLGWPGMLASWFMHQVDVRQAATGSSGSSYAGGAPGSLSVDKVDCLAAAPPRTTDRASGQHRNSKWVPFMGSPSRFT